MPLEEVEVTQLRPERFEEVLTSDALAAFERSMARGRELLGSRAIWNVNSTAFGGGVAEMLRSLIGYARGAGIDGRWVVVEGDPEFFRLTKRLHNRLHGAQGDGGPLGEAERNVYERRCAANAAALVEMLRPGDVVILHDPQTAGMLPALRAAADVPLIWRAHIGLDLPNDLAREAWGFLTPYLGEADAYVFSREAFTWEGLDHARVTVIPPSIDAFSPKNHAMAFTSITAVLRAAGLAAGQHQPHRAVFERLDGSVGFVERRAQMVEEEELRPRQSAARAGLALGPSQGSARRAGRVRRARARGTGAASPAGGPGRPLPSRTTRRAPRSSPSPRPPGASCPRTCAAAFTWRCCRWTMPKRTP